MTYSHCSSTSDLCLGLRAGALLTPLGAGALAFAFPLTIALGHSSGLEWLGPAFAAYFSARLLTAPLAASAADRLGARPVLICACLAAAAVAALGMWAASPLGLAMAQLAAGAASGAVRPVTLAKVAPETSDPAHGPLRVGRVLTWTQAAFVLGPWLGAALMTWGGPKAALGGGAAILAMAAACFARARLPKRSPDAAPERAAWAALGASPTLLRLLPAIMGRGAGIAVWVAFGPVLLVRSADLPPLALAVLFSLPAMATLLGMPLGTRLARRGSHVTTSLAGLLVSAAGLGLLSLGLPMIPLACCAVLMGLGAAVSLPASTALAADVRPGAGVLGVFQAAANAGFVLGPLLASALLRFTASPGAAVALTALTGVLACLPLALLLPRRTRLVTGCLIAGLVCLPAIMSRPVPLLNSGSDLHRFTDLAMGTVVRLTLHSPNAEAAKRAAKAALERMRTLARDLDHRNASGSIGRANLAAGKRPVRVTPEALALLRRSAELSKATNGAFDVTVGALTTKPLFYALGPKAAADAAGLVDFRRVRVNTEAVTVFLPLAGMALDLGGLAKGAVIDAGVETLRAAGIDAGLVEAGGDMYAFGPREWRVGLRHPRSDTLLGVVMLREQALCGSGDYERFVPAPATETGSNTARLHHILKPRDLRPARRVVGTYVTAPTAEQADGLATALFVLGSERGRELLNRHFPATQTLWIDADLRTTSTPAFPTLSPAP